jgi:olefin beta-lactone synthetase
MNQTCNIAAILQNQAQLMPDHLAIISDPLRVSRRARKSITFAQLEAAASRAAMLLRQSGLNQGDVALVFQPMSVDLYVALLALWRLGMVAMFVDPSAGSSHLEQCCRLCPPQALIASSKAHLLRFKSSVLRQIPFKFAIGFPVPGARHWQYDRHLPYETIVTPTTPALITFTSGSTGQPKAAPRTHEFLLAQHQVLTETMQLNSGTRCFADTARVDLTTLPIFVLANLASGVTSLIPNADLRFPSKINSHKIIRQIQTHAPQSIAASPAFLERIADYCEQQNLQLPFQKIFSGGAPVFVDLLERLQNLAPQAQITAVYGSTEAEPIANILYPQIQPADRTAMLNGKGLLTGKPVAAIHLRILPDRWGTPIDAMTDAELEACSSRYPQGVALPPNAPGEIVVSGAHVLPGYLAGQGNAETKFLVNGKPWHRTGDAGYLDEAGRLWLLGRCSARIEDEFGILYPFTVEAAARQPGIHRTALVQLRGRRVLVVELAQSPEAQDALESLKRSLHWANIEDFVICKKIPVDPRHNAKIHYPALYKILEQR